MLKHICCVVLLVAANFASFAQAPDGARKKMHASLPENCKLELDDGSILFKELEIDDGCVVNFGASVTSADVVVQKLILHGNSTIDLSPRNVSLPVPGKPGTPQQARNNPPTQRGQVGTRGGNGANGPSGTNLKLTVEALDATDGALWIRTDGSAGGAGGPGGDGAKGSAGPFTGTHCYDGGPGGDGGAGGTGDLVVIQPKWL